MKNVQISSGVGWGIVAAIVILVVAGYWFFTSPPSAKIDLTKLSKDEIEDKDPPKPGQPGYRERITDPPNP